MPLPWENKDFWGIFDRIKSTIAPPAPPKSWDEFARGLENNLTSAFMEGVPGGVAVRDMLIKMGQTHQEREDMTDEEVSWEASLFKKPTGVPIADFLKQTWQGAMAPTDRNVHNLSVVRSNPLGGAVLRTAEAGMGVLQAWEEGAHAPMFGALANGKVNGFGIFTDPKEYEEARAAYYRLPGAVQLLTQFVDPLTATAEALQVPARIKQVFAAKGLEKAIRAAQRAGHPEVAERLLANTEAILASQRTRPVITDTLNKVLPKGVARVLTPDAPDMGKAASMVANSTRFLDYNQRTVQQIGDEMLQQSLHGNMRAKEVVEKGVKAKKSLAEAFGVAPPTLREDLISKLPFPGERWMTNAARRGQLQRDASTWISHLMRASNDDAAIVGQILDKALSGDTRPMSEVIQEAIKGIPGASVDEMIDLPQIDAFLQSTSGKQFQYFLRVALAPEGANVYRYKGAPDMKRLTQIMARAASEARKKFDIPVDRPLTPEEIKKIGMETGGAIARHFERASELIFPDTPQNPMQRGLGVLKKVLSNVYMRFRPGYAAINQTGNMLPSIVDGTWTFDSIEGIMRYAEDAHVPVSFFTGVGAAERGSNALEIARKSLKDVMTEGDTPLQKLSSMTNMLKLGQALESGTSVRIAVNAMKSVYGPLWKQVMPKLGDDVLRGLGPEVAAALQRKAGNAYSFKLLREAIDDATGTAGIVKVRTLGPSHILQNAAPGLDEALTDLARRSGSMDIRQFDAELGKLRADQQLALARARVAAETDSIVGQMTDNEIKRFVKQKYDDLIHEVNEKQVKAAHAALGEKIREKYPDSPGAVQALWDIDAQTLALSEELRVRKDWMLNGGDPSRNKFGDVISFHPLQHPEGSAERNQGWTDFYVWFYNTYEDYGQRQAALWKNLESAYLAPGARPTVVTDAMKTRLAKLGYNEADIVGMGVDDAQRIIATNRYRAVDAGAAVPEAMARKGMTTARGIYDPNTTYEFRYRVVDNDDLIVSHTQTGMDAKANPAFPQEFQPRDRTDVASRMTTQQRAMNLSVGSLLDEQHSLSDGAPIIYKDMVVESGNGRMMALRQAMQDNPDAVVEYEDTLRRTIANYGLDESDLAGKKHPVLVRERVSEVPNRRKFIDEANTPTVAALGIVEQAMSDASMLTDDMIAGLEIGETQTIQAALASSRNRSFYAEFVGKMPAQTRNAMMTADGLPTAAGAQRMADAIIARTFPKAQAENILQVFSEASTDASNRAVRSGLMAGVGDLARAEALAKNRQGNLSIAADVAAVFDKMASLRRQGIKGADYLAQLTLFDEAALTPLQRQLLNHFDSGSPATNIKTFLKDYANAVENAPMPDQISLFGGDAAPTVEGIVDSILGKYVAPKADDAAKAAAGATKAAPEAAAPAAEPAKKAAKKGKKAAPKPDLDTAAPPVGAVEQPAAPVKGGVRQGTLEGVEPPPYENPTASQLKYDGMKEQHPAIEQTFKSFSEWMHAHWDDVENAADAPTVAALRAWEQEAQRSMAQAQMVSAQYGLDMRDHALHNYSKRYNVDTLMAYLFPYHFWYTRSFVRYAERAAKNPTLALAYMEWQKKINAGNKDLPLQWRNQVPIDLGGQDPIYLNIRQVIDPMYQMMGQAISAQEKQSGTDAEKALALAGGLGPTVYAPYIWLLGALGQLEDPNDAIGYQTAYTRPIKSGTAALRGKGIGTSVIPPGGFVIEEGVRELAGKVIKGEITDSKGVAHETPLQGRDKYDASRTGKRLVTMFNEGEINPETGKPITDDDMTKAMNLRSGKLWEAALQKQGEAETMPNLTSWAFGLGIKKHDVDEIELQTARDEYYNVIKPMKEKDKDAYNAAVDDFKARYPWYFSLSGTYYYQTPEQAMDAYEKTRAYATLLDRVPPGYKKKMSPENQALVDKFFNAGGDVTVFDPTEMKKFSAAMDDLEKQYAKPTAAEKSEYEQVKEEINEYYKLPEGSAERKAYWASHPLLNKYYGNTGSSGYVPRYNSYYSKPWQVRSYGARQPWTPPFKPPKLKKMKVRKGAQKVG